MNWEQDGIIATAIGVVGTAIGGVLVKLSPKILVMMQSKRREKNAERFKERDSYITELKAHTDTKVLMAIVDSQNIKLIDEKKELLSKNKELTEENKNLRLKIEESEDENSKNLSNAMRQIIELKKP